MMSHAAFDTLRFLQKLKASGMPEQQAVALTEAQNEAFMETTDQIATKGDILRLEQNMGDLKQDFKQEITDFRAEVKHEIDHLRTEVKREIDNFRTGVKHEIVSLRAEVTHEINSLRTEVTHEINNLRTEVSIELITVKSNLKLHNWMLGCVLTGVGALIMKTFFI